MRILFIRYSPHFVRSLKKLPRKIQLEMSVRERWFRDDCFDPRLKTHKLSGKLEGFSAFSLTQKYRVLFYLETDTQVGFYDIGDHDVYR